MSKTFKSHKDEDRELHIGERDGNPHLRIHVFGGESRNVTIRQSDAPALCLAILEAAGAHKDSQDYLGGAVEQLIFHIATTEREAAAEADRVALEAEAVKLLHAYDNLGDWTGLVSFSDLPGNMQTKWLAVARAAREINKEAGQ